LVDINLRFEYLLTLMGLGSLPPFETFFFKLLFIFFMLMGGFFFTAISFLMLSVISTFYYVRVIKNIFYDINSPFVILNQYYYPLSNSFVEMVLFSVLFFL
jgi:NADH-quinone oxidoreductase subunit N